MSITAVSLYRDTKNFFHHQLATIILMALVTSFITVLIGHVLLLATDPLLIPDLKNKGGNLFETLQNMSPDQQRILLRISAASIIATLTGHVLLLGGMLCLIPAASAGKNLSALTAMGSAIPLLPRLLLLIFSMTLIIQLGFIGYIVPGIILSILLSLSPVILTTEKSGVIAAMRSSFRLAKKNIRLVAPAVSVWLLIKLLISLLAVKSTFLPATATAVIFTAVSHLASAVLIIFLSRLYMLLR